uniref:Uncharacterized protein n=1 Tax=Myotis myotis TaxID=51298 RepID=A0A7J7Y032_MYOMY|nr:hypothetical protein mMyoMyo1_011428 [Myotis myotis]
MSCSTQKRREQVLYKQGADCGHDFHLDTRLSERRACALAAALRGGGGGWGAAFPSPLGTGGSLVGERWILQSALLLTFLRLSFLSYEDKLVRFFDFCEPVAQQVRVTIHRRSRESTCGARGPAPAREK